jgi:acetyl esterase/lipase
MQDIRDLLTWIHDGHLNKVLCSHGAYSADINKIAAFGTSSGGTLALGLVCYFILAYIPLKETRKLKKIQGFNIPRPVKAILSLYGAVHFTDPFWKTPLPHVASKLPPNLDPAFLSQIYQEIPIPTDSSVSLEGQSEAGGSKGPNFSRPRDAFAFTQIANGTVMDAIYPDGKTIDPYMEQIDPVKNVSAEFPPTWIVHGLEDTMVPIGLSRELYGRLREAGVQCGMTEVPGEEHTFAMLMKVGSRTWWLQREGFDFLEGIIGKGPQTAPN